MIGIGEAESSRVAFVRGMLARWTAASGVDTVAISALSPLTVV